MVIITGKLDRRIVIERATETRDAIGGVTRTWATLTTVWAQEIPLPGKEMFQAGRETIVRVSRFIIRYVSGVTAKDRLNYDGKIWNITAVAELGRKTGLEILAEVVK